MQHIYHHTDDEEHSPESLQNAATSNSQAGDRRERRQDGGTRSARLSHRSRAGCWTCRARKVKCDEARPRCGPCTRLNRDCDWGQRWNFSDATLTTQDKHTNVKTAGNVVWDPRARRHRPTQHLYNDRDDDEDPEFPCLTADEDRERKAETRRPGTFGLVLTPTAFLRSEIPEYASSADGRLQQSNIRAPRPRYGRQSNRLAPNVVILDRFEDASPVSASWPPGTDRRRSDPELASLSIKTEALSTGYSTAPGTPLARSDEHLIRHFRQYIVPRLVQPQHPGTLLPSSIPDVLEYEAARFRPLHHSICAISALNLAYSGLMSLEEAMQHYHQALGAQTTAAGPHDLLSDGVFFRHFLLFIYDISMAAGSGDNGGANMWAEHLNHLRRLTVSRRRTSASLGSSYGYVVWKICELDMYACLMGSGHCEFLQAICNEDMLPPLESQVPFVAALSSMAPGAPPFLPGETHSFPAVLKLYERVVTQTAKIAMAAQSFRLHAPGSQPTTPGLFAQWQANTAQLQNELLTLWMQAYPYQYVGSDLSAPVVENLPERVRSVFDSAVLLFHAAMIYSRTSMYPGQGRMPTANQHSLLADTEARVAAILSLAMPQIPTATNTATNHSSSSNNSNNNNSNNNNNIGISTTARHLVFPVFIAGVATALMPNKTAAINTISRLEDSGIGRNTVRTRRLLVLVYEEQARRVQAGGKIEDVDWLQIARAHGLDVVNCGL